MTVYEYLKALIGPVPANHELVVWGSGHSLYPPHGRIGVHVLLQHLPSRKNYRADYHGDNLVAAVEQARHAILANPDYFYHLKNQPREKNSVRAELRPEPGPRRD